MKPFNMVLAAAFPALVLPPFASGLEGSLGGGLFTGLIDYLESLREELSQIDEGRRSDLRTIAEYVTRKRAAEKEAELLFICTHNSRRSHMAQIWAQVVAHHLGVTGVTAYSGGTEATAFAPRAVTSMKEAGIKIRQRGPSSNPVYSVSFASGVPSMEAWSKKFSDSPNPQKDFCAVMVCSQADEACPFVPGAEKRVSIPYEDPKAFDGTPQETEKYHTCCRQIAREMLYLFTRVK